MYTKYENFTYFGIMVTKNVIFTASSTVSSSFSKTEDFIKISYNKNIRRATAYLDALE